MKKDKKLELGKLESIYNNYKKSETFEYIDEIKSIKITQNNDFFKYGIDSFLLSDFFLSQSKIVNDIKNGKKVRVADICSGTGIISINTFSNMKTSYDSLDISNFSCDCFEVQKYFYYLNLKNIIENSLKNFEVFNINVLDNDKIINFKNSYDYIIINPPYFSNNTNIVSSNKEKEIAKFWTKEEYNCFFKNAYIMLKNLGEIYIISRIENIFNIQEVAKVNKLELKVLQLVAGTPKKSPKLFMAVFKKRAKEGFNTLPCNYINEK